MEVESEESSPQEALWGMTEGGKEGVRLTLLAFHKIRDSVLSTTALPRMEEAMSVTE